MINIAIFASGNGSNAQAIADYLSEHSAISIKHIFCNKPDAYVIKRAENLSIPVTVFNRTDFYDTASVEELLKKLEINWIVLAGFLWLIPGGLISRFRGHIINIHPALLPDFGGKGMYGHKVHEAVIASGKTESGITIHLVDEEYDHGKVLFQAKCTVESSDTPDSLAQKIHQLEHLHFPAIVEKTILQTC